MKEPADIINFVRAYRFPDGRSKFRNPEFTAFCAAFLMYLSLKENGTSTLECLPYSLESKGFSHSTAGEIDRAFFYDEVPGGTDGIIGRKNAKKELGDFIRQEIQGGTIIPERILDYLQKMGHFPNKGSRDLGAFSLPNDVAKLVANILEIESSDRVLDLCCGDSTFLRTVENSSRLIGMDMSMESLAISAIMLFLEGRECELQCANVFDPSTKGLLADKIFCNPEWRSLSADERLSYFPNFVIEKVGGFNTFERVIRHAEWFYLARALAALDPSNPNSKAVVVLPYSALMRERSAEILGFLASEQFLEGIIALPDRSMNFSAVRPCLMVLGGNKAVRKKGRVKLLDAAKLMRDAELSVSRGRGWRRTEINVDEILKRYRYCEPVEPDFTAGRLFAGTDDGLDSNTPSVRLGEIAEILSTTTIHPLERSDIGTEYHVIKPGAISNGEIVGSGVICHCLEQVPDVEFLSKGDVLVPRMGNFSKGSVAIVDSGHEGQGWITSSNLLVIRIRQDMKSKYPPEYVRAYLSSSKGIEALLAGCSGSVKTIKQAVLKELVIPGLMRPDEFLHAYTMRVREIADCRARLEKLEAEIESMI